MSQPIPVFISIDENKMERPIYILPYENTNGYWEENKILFYKSTGTSNNRQSVTGDTWFPFYGFINKDNESYFKDKHVKKRDPETGKETVDFPKGYLIKLSMIHEIKNKEEQDTTRASIPKKYYLKEVNEFIMKFVDSLQEEKDFKEFDDSFIVRLNDYFTEVNQIVWSVWLNEEASLWKNRPLFKNFVKQQPYYQSLPDVHTDILQEPSTDHSDSGFFAFLQKNGFPLNYPVNHIEKIVQKEGNFIEQGVSITYKNRSIQKLRGKTAILRLTSKVSAQEPKVSEPEPKVSPKEKKPKRKRKPKVSPESEKKQRKSARTAKKGGNKKTRKNR